MLTSKKQIFQYISAFIFIIIIMIIGQKIFGEGSIVKVGPNDPMEWSEILHELPITIIISISIIAFFAWSESALKKKEKKIEDARRKKDKDINDKQQTNI